MSVKGAWRTITSPAARTIGAFLLIGYLMLGHMLGELEGRLFPVVVDVHLELTENQTFPPDNMSDPYRTRLAGSFTKLRDCRFSGVEFRYGGELSYSVASVYFEELARVRHPGDHSFGPWVVALGPRQVPHAHALVYHQCPWRPWRTVTIFYDPSGALE